MESNLVVNQNCTRIKNQLCLGTVVVNMLIQFLFRRLDARQRYWLYAYDRYYHPVYLRHRPMCKMVLHEGHADIDHIFRLIVGVYRKTRYFECHIDLRSFVLKGKLIFLPSAMPCHYGSLWNINISKNYDDVASLLRH